MKNYELISVKPCAKFYYKGSHSHPVRRTVLITKADSSYLTGYEVREGANTRLLEFAPVKTYRRDEIARYSECRQRVRHRVAKKLRNVTTLRRTGVQDLVNNGV